MPMQPTSNKAPAITVCIPVYKPRDFLRQTLESVRRQSFSDFQVLVAIEPAGQTDISFLGSILEDSRFRFFWNSEVLGWAANINSLLQRVDTEFFAILPHDDALHSKYLTTLHEALIRNPDAIAAYADILFLGHQTAIKSRLPDNTSLFARLWAFYLGGAEAVPWRGLTRSRALDGGKTFPNNRFTGFAVECEWAQHLLSTGATLRCTDTLYYKRTFAPGEETVSSGWVNKFDTETLAAALEWHRKAMLAGIPAQLSTDDKLAVTLACELAMLHRWLTLHQGRRGFGQSHRERIQYVRTYAERLAENRRAALLARLEDSLSRAALIEGDTGGAIEHSRLAVDLDNTYAEARIRYVHALLHSGHQDDATAQALILVKLEPLAAGHRQLFEICATALEHRLAKWTTNPLPLS